MQNVYNEQVADNPQPLRIPLNSYAEGAGTKFAGMMSYPFQRKTGYRLCYPVLELVYNACAEAGVQCSHVYIYRHPLNVLKSTTINRPFNSPGMVSATHLYTSHLKIIETQLRSYADRTRACFGFFDEKGSEEWQGPMRDLWGWTASNNQTGFENLIQEEYRKPTKFLHSTSDNIIAEEIEGIFPAEHLPYLELFLKAHERVVELCKQSVPGS